MILKQKRLRNQPFLLPRKDSNLDKQNQNLSYYLYTTGQGSAKVKHLEKTFKSSREKICEK